MTPATITFSHLQRPWPTATVENAIAVELKRQGLQLRQSFHPATPADLLPPYRTEYDPLRGALTVTQTP